MRCTNMCQILAILTFIRIVTDIVVTAADYFHDEDVVGWIKVHRVPTNFKTAYLTCYYEGAILASPINEALAEILDEKVQGTNGLYIGVHSLFSEGDFLSVEGVALNDMPVSVVYGNKPDDDCVMLTTNKQAQTTNCSRMLPFMCYRNRRKQPVNFKCGTFDNKYVFSSRTGSCYKLHEECHEWAMAHLICVSEGGYLAVINDADEADVLRNMSLKRTLKISQYEIWEPLFIGLRDWDKKGTWVTVLGDNIQNVYHSWGWGQPDNTDKNQFCGSLLQNGKLDDTWCNVKAIFICEKDPEKVRFLSPNKITEPDPMQLSEVGIDTET